MIGYILYSIASMKGCIILLYRNSLFLLFLSSTPLFVGMNYCTWLLDPAQNFPVFQRCPLLWLMPPQSAENKLTAYFLNNYNIIGDKLLLNVLAPNFKINLKLKMWNYKIAMAFTFLMLQCQYGFKVLKCYEWRCQDIQRRFRKPKRMTEHITKNSNNSILLKNSETWELFYKVLKVKIYAPNASVHVHFLSKF